MDMVSTIKDWLKGHPKVWKITLVVIIFIFALTFARLFFLNSENNSEGNSEEATVEFTDVQGSIYSNYSDETFKFISLLTNNRWLSKQKTSNALFTEKQIVERKNEEEHIMSYAICDLEKGQKDKQSTEEVYYFTVLLGSNKYQQAELWIRHIGTSESSPVETVYILGEGLFWGADSYERCIPAEKLIINNWDPSVNSLIDNKEDEMNQKIKEYLFLYYPQIGELNWNTIAAINYFKHTISLNFTFTLSNTNTVYIVCVYSKDTGSFEVGKGQSAESLEIKRNAV